MSTRWEFLPEFEIDDRPQWGDNIIAAMLARVDAIIHPTNTPTANPHPPDPSPYDWMRDD